MPNKIEPAEYDTEIDAFSAWVTSIEETLDLDLHPMARKHLENATRHLAYWTLTKGHNSMDVVIGTLVSAIIYDPQVSVVLGAYIAWGRFTVAQREG